MGKIDHIQADIVVDAHLNPLNNLLVLIECLLIVLVRLVFLSRTDDKGHGVSTRAAAVVEPPLVLFSRLGRHILVERTRLVCVELGCIVTIGGRKRNRMPNWVDIVVVLGNDLDTMVRLGRTPMGRAQRKLAGPLVP